MSIEELSGLVAPSNFVDGVTAHGHDVATEFSQLVNKTNEEIVQINANTLSTAANAAAILTNIGQIAANAADIAEVSDNYDGSIVTSETVTGSFEVSDSNASVIYIDNISAHTAVTIPLPSTLDTGFTRTVINIDSLAAYRISVSDGAKTYYLAYGDSVTLRVGEYSSGTKRWVSTHHVKYQAGNIESGEVTDGVVFGMTDIIRTVGVPWGFVSGNSVVLPNAGVHMVGWKYTVINKSAYSVDVTADETIRGPSSSSTTFEVGGVVASGETNVVVFVSDGLGGWYVENKDREKVLSVVVMLAGSAATVDTSSGGKVIELSYGASVITSMPCDDGNYPDGHNRDSSAMEPTLAGTAVTVTEGAGSDTSGFPPFTLDIPEWTKYVEVVAHWAAASSASQTLYSLTFIFSDRSIGSRVAF